MVELIKRAFGSLRGAGAQAYAVMGVMLGGLLFAPAFAGAAPLQADPDPVLDSIDTVQDKVLSYVGPIVLAIVAIGLAAVAFKLVPRVISMISARLR